MPAPFMNPMLGNNLNALNQQAQIQKILMDQMRPGMKRPLPSLDGSFIHKRPLNMDTPHNLLNPLLLQNQFQLSNPIQQKNDEVGRMPHRLIEKKRRDRINSCINTLRDLLPDQIKKATNRPLEKAIVLELAIDYIKDLQKNQVKEEVKDVKVKKEVEDTSEETQKSLCTQLAASYEKGWNDCSSAIKQSDSEITLPTLPKEKCQLAAEEIFKTFETPSTAQKRMPSGSSEGYLSDERQRNTSSNECSSESDDNKPNPVKVQVPVTVKQEAVDHLVQLHQSTESDEDFEIDVDC